MRVRLRIRFAKVGKVRWTSHRDLARMWERAFRRVGLPLAYSEGFSPRPRVSFGLALPTGHESVAEFLDVELTCLEGIDLEALPSRLSGALPVGVDATAVAVLPPGAPSLQEEVTSCGWKWMVEGASGPEELAERVTALLRSGSAPVTRNRKGAEVVEDVRPGILELGLDDGWLIGELATTPRAVRPADVTAGLGPGLEAREMRRTSQWITRSGARREPLDAAGPSGATAAPHAWERAS